MGGLDSLKRWLDACYAREAVQAGLKVPPRTETDEGKLVDGARRMLS